MLLLEVCVHLFLICIMIAARPDYDMGEYWQMDKLFNRDIGSCGACRYACTVSRFKTKTLVKIMHTDGEFGILCF